MTALIQNFSIPADNDVKVVLQVDPNLDLDLLSGATLNWRAYEQAFGIPLFDAMLLPSPVSPPPSPLIEKSSHDGSVTVMPSPPPATCQIQIARSDTAAMLRNYYHETTMIDGAGNISTLNCGIMTVTATLNR